MRKHLGTILCVAAIVIGLLNLGCIIGGKL